MYRSPTPWKIRNSLPLVKVSARLCTLVLLLLSAFSSLAANTVPTKDQSSRQILVLGDSLSAAYQLDKDQGWVTLLENKLKSEGYLVDINNASVSGLTIAGGEQILFAHIESAQKPELIIIELGANDGLQGRPIPYIQQSLTRLVKQAKNSGADVLLLGIQLPPNRGKRYTEPFFGLYEKIATSEKAMLMPFLLEGVAGNSELMKKDGLHPNAEGQKHVLNNIYPLISKWLKQQDKQRSK